MSQTPLVQLYQIQWKYPLNKYSNFCFSNDPFNFRYNCYTYMGTDLPYVAATGRVLNNKFVGNTLSGGRETIKLKESSGTLFENNSFTDATVIRLDDADAIMKNNTGLRGVEMKTVAGGCFDLNSDPGFRPTCAQPSV